MLLNSLHELEGVFVSKGEAGESYILSENFYSIKRFFEMCHDLTGLDIPKIELPLGVAYLGIPFEKIKSYLLKKEGNC